MFVPLRIAKTQTQVLFNESNQDNSTSTYDSWYTEQKLSNDGNELSVDTGSAQHVDSPKYRVASLQTEARVGVQIKITT